jgi:ssDNA-binding Zn-finger/Zn-ribbon topoisomerase 1
MAYDFGELVKVKPVFLVRKTNKKTGDWFYGCPNFPKCKYSENRPLTKAESDAKVCAWANAQCGPHY